MASRLKLQALFKTLVNNVYFQPPESIKLQYPCIIYHMTAPNTKHADDGLYNLTKHYQATLIHKNPDNDIVDKMTELSYCRMAQSFCKDNLYHYVFDIYF